MNRIPPLNAAWLLKKYGLRADKRLGQNYLQDASALEKIVEAADMQNGGGQIECGFGVRSEERPRFLRVLIGPQRQMESRFNICGSAVHIQDQAIRMGRGHRQTVGRSEFG